MSILEEFLCVRSKAFHCSFKTSFEVKVSPVIMGSVGAAVTRHITRVIIMRVIIITGVIIVPGCSTIITPNIFITLRAFIRSFTGRSSVTVVCPLILAFHRGYLFWRTLTGTYRARTEGGGHSDVPETRTVSRTSHHEWANDAYDI